MEVSIFSPQGVVFEGKATFVKAPAEDGMLGILKNHAPLITTLKTGKVTIRLESDEKTYPVSDGVLEVLDNKVIIVTQ